MNWSAWCLDFRNYGCFVSVWRFFVCLIYTLIKLNHWVQWVNKTFDVKFNRIRSYHSDVVSWFKYQFMNLNLIKIIKIYSKISELYLLKYRNFQVTSVSSKTLTSSQRRLLLVAILSMLCTSLLTYDNFVPPLVLMFDDGHWKLSIRSVLQSKKFVCSKQNKSSKKTGTDLVHCHKNLYMTNYSFVGMSKLHGGVIQTFTLYEFIEFLDIVLFFMRDKEFQKDHDDTITTPHLISL